MRGLEHTEGKPLDSGHTARKWPSKHVSSGSLAQEPTLLTTVMESAHKVPMCEILRNNTEDLKTDIKDHFNDFQLPPWNIMSRRT